MNFTRIILFILLIFSISAIKDYSLTQNEIRVSNFVLVKEKTYQGKIIPSKKAVLSFENSGKIAYLPYKKGDYLQKGEVVARLENDFSKKCCEKSIIAAPYNGFVEEKFCNYRDDIKKNCPVVSFLECNTNEIEVIVPNYEINRLNLEKECKIIKNNEKFSGKIVNISKSSISDDKYCLTIRPDDSKKFSASGNVEVDINLR